MTHGFSAHFRLSVVAAIQTMSVAPRPGILIGELIAVSGWVVELYWRVGNLTRVQAYRADGNDLQIIVGSEDDVRAVHAAISAWRSRFYDEFGKPFDDV